MTYNTAIVVGAGIVGLAMTRALARRGTRVTVFERHERAVGASVRNLGLIWPLASATPSLYARAVRSREIWREFCEAAQVWHEPSDCVIAAHDDDEWAAIQELVETHAHARPLQALTAARAREQYPSLLARGLKGVLVSTDELLVDPRVALRRLPDWLTHDGSVEFRWKHAVTRIEPPYVWSGGRRHAADRIVIASGADFEALYPQAFAHAPVVRRTLSLLRMATPPSNFRLGAIVCSGDSLLRCSGLRELPSFARLQERYRRESPDMAVHGAGVVALQGGGGEIAVGDLGMPGEPESNDGLRLRRLLEQLRRVVQLPEYRVAHSWQGVHACLNDGGSELVMEVEPGVTVVNAVGGNGLGMTLAFGLAEEIAAERWLSGPACAA